MILVKSVSRAWLFFPCLVEKPHLLSDSATSAKPLSCCRQRRRIISNLEYTLSSAINAEQTSRFNAGRGSKLLQPAKFKVGSADLIRRKEFYHCPLSLAFLPFQHLPLSLPLPIPLTPRLRPPRTHDPSRTITKAGHDPRGVESRRPAAKSVWKIKSEISGRHGKS